MMLKEQKFTEENSRIRHEMSAVKSKLEENVMRLEEEKSRNL